MPLKRSITKQGITAKFAERGVTAKLAERGVVAKVDETLDEIAPPIPPVITLTLDSIDVATDPGEVTTRFVFSDADGAVEKIELFQRFNLGAAVSIQVFEPPDPSPFLHQITGLAEGDYCWFAVATDDEGLSTQSNMIQATINPVDLIVTFDVPPDGIIANGAGVPGFASIIKGYSTGTNGVVRQVSGIGRTTSLSNSDGAFFTLEDDLNLLNVDTTWEVIQKINVTSISGSRYMNMVRGTKTTSKIALWPTDVILIAQMLSDLRVAFFYRNTSGTLVQLGLFSNAYVIGVETNMEIKKDATNYTFTIGAVSSVIAISSVQAETNHFYTVGAFATVINIHVGENDDIERK